jgi:Ca2+-binding RTX toxin-like protein
MAIDFDTARVRLATESFTVQGLFDLVKQVSGRVAGAASTDTFFLFSGLMPNSAVKTLDVVEGAVANNNYAHSIGNSDVGRLLNLLNFDAKLRQALAIEMYGTTIQAATPSQLQQIEARFDLLKNGIDANKNRVSSTSLFDIASTSYVTDNKGDFRVVATEIANNSVLKQSELVALLAKTDGSTLSGIAIDQVKRIGSFDAIVNAIRIQSFTEIAFTGLSTANTTDYLRLTPDTLASFIGDRSKLDGFNTLMNSMSAEFKLQFSAAAKAMDEAGAALAKSGVVGAANKIFLVAILVGLCNTSYASTQAYLQGDNKKAADIAAAWATEFSGGLAAGAGASALATISIGLLATAGAVVSAPIAAAFIFTCGLAGALFGAEGAAEFYKLMQNENLDTQQKLVDGLSRLLFGANATITSPLPADLNGARYTINANLSATQIADAAKQDIAWRYALRELNGFAVTDVSYTSYNTNGSLDRYNPTTGQGTMTDAYLLDRASMLKWNLVRNGANNSASTSTVQGQPGMHFQDIKTGIEFDLGLPNNVVEKRQTIFGGDGADTITGKKLEDHLYGGAGADTLDGKGGNDYLEGGVGADTYQFTGSFGHDTILDADGQGSITVGSATLAGGTKLADNLWESADKTLIYTLVNNGTASQPSQDLIIGQRTAAGSNNINATITVQNWQAGQLGINLAGSSAPLPNAGFVVMGSYLDSQRYTRDPSLTNASSAPAGGWRVDAGAGNDLIAGSDQAETLSGGAGNDFIAGGGGKDILLGGDGFDYIVADTRAIDSRNWNYSQADIDSNNTGYSNGGLDKNGQLRALCLLTNLQAREAQGKYYEKRSCLSRIYLGYRAKRHIKTSCKGGTS